MAPKQADQADQVLSLPVSVVSRVDATRLARELEIMDNQLEQQKHGQSPAMASSLSRLLDEAAKINHLDLNQVAQRQRLQAFLKEVKTDAPVIHMSFAVVPPSAFTIKLVNWLRSEVHPLLLLEIGLQPSIAAGCIIRTTSKYFDCSMRQHLVQNKPKLLELLKAGQHA